MSENGESITDAALQTAQQSKKFIIEVTPPLSEEDIRGLAPQIRSDQTLARREECFYSIFEPIVQTANAASVDGSSVQRFKNDSSNIEIPEPTDDITLDLRMESYFTAARMRHESEAVEPHKNKKDVADELATAREYEIAASAIHSGVVDPKSTKILYARLGDLGIYISGSSAGDIVYRAKLNYANKIAAMYQNKFPLRQEERKSLPEQGKAFFTSIVGKFGLKK